MLLVFRRPNTRTRARYEMLFCMHCMHATHVVQSKKGIFFYFALYIVQVGPPNSRTFTQRCSFSGETACGKGVTKQGAKHRAAQIVCEKLGICKLSTVSDQPLSAMAVEISSFPWRTASALPLPRFENVATKENVPAKISTVVVNYPPVIVKDLPKLKIAVVKLPTRQSALNVSQPVRVPVSVQSSYGLLPDLYAVLSTRSPDTISLFGKCATVDEILSACESTATDVVETLAENCGIKIEKTLVCSPTESKLTVSHSTHDSFVDNDFMDQDDDTSPETDITEKSFKSAVGVILTLTTVPKIVCAGFGKNKSEAWEDACRQILLHIKVMKCSSANDAFSMVGG